MFYDQNICIPQNSYTEILSPKTMVLSSGTFVRWLEHEGTVLMNGTSTLTKEAQEWSLFLSFLTWGYSEKVPVHESWNVLTLDIELAGVLVWRIPTSRIVRYIFHLFISYLVHDILL